jgi:hypothetical protein
MVDRRSKGGDEGLLRSFVLASVIAELGITERMDGTYDVCRLDLTCGKPSVFELAT